VFRSNVLFNAIPREPVYSTLEMDTHADTCVLGPNFIILHYKDENVMYHPTLKSMKTAKLFHL
jgi:hypothetical protein